MANTTFDQARADEIAAGATSNDAAVFCGAVAFADGVSPTAAGIAQAAFSSDFAIDASTFVADSETRGSVTARAGGQEATMKLYRQAGTWKLDSTGSSSDVVTAR
ncbi:hypothetical protein ACSAGD_09750 [Paramicrobacterium sp. CJ85]|uniref:hypothetical protein n=1 Tax=Paramicrobacterium sp. CJ85 TaxID=3445355 RepID=UPI003F617807